MKLYPNNYFGDAPLLRNPRSVVEFSFNGVINLWKDAKVVVLVPLSAAREMKFVNFWYTATSYFGPFRIPEGSTILVKDSMFPDTSVVEQLAKRGIEVRIFPKKEKNKSPY